MAEREISKTQIDRLGDRLKKGNITDDDLRLLDIYRDSFSEAYGIVVGRIRKDIGLSLSLRFGKTTESISDKLRRESIRLTQIQDIAGCRLIVPYLTEQEECVGSLREIFENVTVVDRRKHPSHGYRAVHVIVYCLDKVIEIQVRTSLQHLWAELSEKLSDVVDPRIKYGGGHKGIQDILEKASDMVAVHELIQQMYANNEGALSLRDDVTERKKQRMADILDQDRKLIIETLKGVIEKVPRFKGVGDDISD